MLSFSQFNEQEDDKQPIEDQDGKTNFECIEDKMNGRFPNQPIYGKFMNESWADGYKGNQHKAVVYDDYHKDNTPNVPEGLGKMIKKKGPRGVVVPAHAEEHAKTSHIPRTKVYGTMPEAESAPLTFKKSAEIDKKHLDDHFTLREGENEVSARRRQISEEKEAIQRLHKARVLSSDKNFFSKSPKTETSEYETGEHGEQYTDVALKGLASHHVYTNDHGKHHVVNTCGGQTEGCGGGSDEDGVATPYKGTCFTFSTINRLEDAYKKRANLTNALCNPNDGVQRADGTRGHSFRRDVALAMAHNLRKMHEESEKKGRTMVVRPNTTDETDYGRVRHIVDHLNSQNQRINSAPQNRTSKVKNIFRKIMTYAYGKVHDSDHHDPENGHHRVFSNTGPLVKNGNTIHENEIRDNSRVSETTDNKHGPNRNSYLVINADKGSDVATKFAKHAHTAVYWSKGHPAPKDGSPDEAHYDANGKPTTEEHAHYGHKTIGGMRFHYQKQNLLHQADDANKVTMPVQYEENLKDKDGNTVYRPKKNPDDKPKPMKRKYSVMERRESDARFLDDHKHAKKFGKDSRYKTKSGKNAGLLVVSTPTDSTSNDKKQNDNLTHHVDSDTVKRVMENHGVWHINHPHDQLDAMTRPAKLKGGMGQ